MVYKLQLDLRTICQFNLLHTEKCSSTSLSLPQNLKKGNNSVSKTINPGLKAIQMLWWDPKQVLNN